MMSSALYGLRRSLFRQSRLITNRQFSYGTIEPSISAKNTVNPIRRIVDNIKAKPNPELEVIPLSIGDPTIFGNFRPPDTLAEEIGRQAASLKVNGYGHSCGMLEAREAVARKFAPSTTKFPLTADDVVLTNGCSHALDLAIQVLANPGQNILIPRPGFPLYETLCGSRGIGVKHYRLDPAKQWDIDLNDMENLIDQNTACILINSPSNPCGNVFSREHLAEICQVAKKHKLPLIADEIYANMAFPGTNFTMLNDVSDDVPFISVGGLAKQYMIPGWRVGWATLHDREEALTEVKQGFIDLSTLLVGPSTLQQACIPHLLHRTADSYYNSVMQQLAENASVVCETFKDCRSLQVIEPQGAMYVLVKILDSKFEDDTAFANALIEEKSVVVLPGQCFGVDKFFRIVISPPKEKLVEACKRIKSFMEKHD